MRIMDHTEAVRTKAAERYLLGEMAARDRDEYEEHFFGCLECARDVQAGAAFIDSARDVLASVPGVTAKPKPVSGSWWGWLLRPAFALPAMALLLVVAVYQAGFVIPRMKSELSQATAPQASAWLSLLNANSRGGEAPQITIPANKPLGLFVDLPPGTQFSDYICDVQADSGSVKFSVNVSAEEAKQTVLVTVPAGKLMSGKYTLVVRGYESSQPANKVEVARFPFALALSR
jgi:hypothetical protein